MSLSERRETPFELYTKQLRKASTTYIILFVVLLFILFCSVVGVFTGVIGTRFAKKETQNKTVYSVVTAISVIIMLTVFVCLYYLLKKFTKKAIGEGNKFFEAFCDGS
jgi:uncharacterized BrkB/YihY/UPF0761 family membrane protein